MTRTETVAFMNLCMICNGDRVLCRIDRRRIGQA